jgi:peptide/nickel transport system substrate-binding protein
MSEINSIERCSLATRGVSTIALLIVMAGCSRMDAPAMTDSSRATLTVGYEPNAVSIQQAVSNLAVEGLLDFGRDGRPRPWLAEKWSSSEDGLALRVSLKADATFHDGERITATAVRDILAQQLPQYLREPFEDIISIRAVSDRELEFVLRRRSTFLLEGLEAPIRKPGTAIVGTGPFHASIDTETGAEMHANTDYYGGIPSIRQITFRPYPSVRSAWADMLRGKVDMLYEVDVDALDFLERSSDINVFTFQRPYVHAVVLNVERRLLRDAALRRVLNAAIDRQQLVSTVLGGYGAAADGPIPPSHWARDPTAPGFAYEPRLTVNEAQSVRLTCIFGDPSLERMALTVQRQLQAVGVDLGLESVSGTVLIARLESGDFDCAVVDIISGPNLLRPYWFWHSKGPHNWGRYRNTKIDSALDAIRHAAGDDEYRAGVAAFQREIVNDPPAIFLAWSQRARAVSTRFQVPVEPGRDILSTLRLWRPVGDQRLASRN